MKKIIKRNYWGIPDEEYDAKEDEYGDYYNAYNSDGTPTYPLYSDDDDEYGGM